jgi:hypothetical protein
MNTSDDRDRLISAWLDLEAPATAPDDLRIDIQRATARIRPRPAWLARLRRSPMDVITGGAGARRSFRLAPVLLLVLLLLLLIAAAAGFYVGSPRDPALAIAPTASPTSTPIASPAPSPTPPTDASPLVEGQFTACEPGNTQIKEGTERSAASGDVTIERKRGFTWSGAITATDPRFSGTHYYSYDANFYTLPSGQEYTTWAEGHVIQNEEGAWRGASIGAVLPDESPSGVARLTGEGGYAGLTALLFIVDGDCVYNFEGIVAEVPDPPEPYTGG